MSGATLKFQDSRAGTANTLMTLQDLNGTGSTGKLTVNTLAAVNIGAFTATGNITAASTQTISGFLTINGATISGGSFSGGEVSGGTLSGGTYTDTGAQVAGDYTTTIGDTRSFSVFDGTQNIFTVADGGTVGNISRIGSIDASGTITFSSLNTAGVVVNSNAGVLSTQKQLAHQGEEQD